MTLRTFVLMLPELLASIALLIAALALRKWAYRRPWSFTINRPPAASLNFGTPLVRLKKGTITMREVTLTTEEEALIPYKPVTRGGADSGIEGDALEFDVASAGDVVPSNANGDPGLPAGFSGMLIKSGATVGDFSFISKGDVDRDPGETRKRMIEEAWTVHVVDPLAERLGFGEPVVRAKS